MRIIAKGLEALGIACVMLGLVQGIQTENMWIELYLSVIGIVLFLIGWGIEKLLRMRLRRHTKSVERSSL